MRRRAGRAKVCVWCGKIIACGELYEYSYKREHHLTATACEQAPTALEYIQRAATYDLRKPKARKGERKTSSFCASMSSQALEPDWRLSFTGTRLFPCFWCGQDYALWRCVNGWVVSIECSCSQGWDLKLRTPFKVLAKEKQKAALEAQVREALLKDNP